MSSNAGNTQDVDTNLAEIKSKLETAQADVTRALEEMKGGKRRKASKKSSKKSSKFL